MKGIFRALFWLMAVSLVLSVTHAQESDANTEQEFTDLQGIDVEAATEEADRNLQELDLEQAGYEENVVDEGVLTDEVEEDSRRLQDDFETEDSFDEENSGMLENVEEGEDRRLRFRQLKPAVTSWNYAPESSLPIPSKKSSSRTSKKQKIKKSRTRHIKKDYDHKKAAPAHSKYIPAPVPDKKLPEWTPAPSKKAPVIAAPSKKGTSSKKLKVRKQKVKKSKKTHGHGNDKKY